MNPHIKALFDAMGLKVQEIDLDAGADTPTADNILDAFKEAMGEGKKKKAELDPIDYAGARSVFGDLHNQEKQAKIVSEIPAFLKDISEDEFNMLLRALLTQSTCGCGDPKHWIDRVALAFLFPYLNVRVQAGKKV